MKKLTVYAMFLGLVLAGRGFAEPKYHAKSITWPGYYAIGFVYMSPDGTWGTGTAVPNNNVLPYMIPTVCFAYEKGTFRVVNTPGFSCAAEAGNSSGDFVGYLIDLNQLAALGNQNATPPSYQYFHYSKAKGTFDPIPTLPNYTTVTPPYPPAKFAGMTDAGDLFGGYSGPIDGDTSTLSAVVFKLKPNGALVQLPGTAPGNLNTIFYNDNRGDAFGCSQAANGTQCDFVEWPATGGVKDLNIKQPTLSYYYINAKGHSVEVLGDYPNTDNECIFSNGEKSITIWLAPAGASHKYCSVLLADTDDIMGVWIPPNQPATAGFLPFYYNPSLPKPEDLTSVTEGLPSGTILLAANFANQTNGLVWATGSSSLPGPPGAYVPGDPDTLYLLTPIKSDSKSR
jgi:hypothetical protein